MLPLLLTHTVLTSPPGEVLEDDVTSSSGRMHIIWSRTVHRSLAEWYKPADVSSNARLRWDPPPASTTPTQPVPATSMLAHAWLFCTFLQHAFHTFPRAWQVPSRLSTFLLSFESPLLPNASLCSSLAFIQRLNLSLSNSQSCTLWSVSCSLWSLPKAMTPWNLPDREAAVMSFVPTATQVCMRSSPGHEASSHRVSGVPPPTSLIR